MIQNRSILYEFLRLQKKSHNPSYPTTRFDENLVIILEVHKYISAKSRSLKKEFSSFLMSFLSE